MARNKKPVKPMKSRKSQIKSAKLIKNNSEIIKKLTKEFENYKYL
jgi:hypothetical protein